MNGGCLRKLVLSVQFFLVCHLGTGIRIDLPGVWTLALI